jgi:hypothetical protein
MPALDDDLSDFAGAIARGDEPSQHIAARYQHYSVDVAIEIYRNNYRGNLRDTLAGAYPVIEQLVGMDFFRLLTRQYMAQYPSRSGNLHHYGAEMASFIATFEPAEKLPYLADVAALEWACHCAYFAVDAAPIDIARLAQMPSEQYPELILHIHPACRQLRSNYPIAAIWHAHQPGSNSDFNINLDSGPCFALVSRKDNEICVNELNAADADWLQKIHAGAPLGDATEATLQHHPDLDLQAALKNLVELGVFSDFNLRTVS